jgi:ribosomal protein S18 acetylase RimI-like enzyme
MSSQELVFKPIDLEKNLDLTIRFREDAFICSFGTGEKFWQENGPKAERYVEWLRTKLEKDPQSAVHVWQGNRIVGQMELSRFKPDPAVGYVNLYYIVPEFRGSGISHLLDEYAVKYLRARGHEIARLSVSPSNPRAVRYYTRMGWTDLGVRADAPDRVFFEREFRGICRREWAKNMLFSSSNR